MLSSRRSCGAMVAPGNSLRPNCGAVIHHANAWRQQRDLDEGNSRRDAEAQRIKAESGKGEGAEAVGGVSGEVELDDGWEFAGIGEANSEGAVGTGLAGPEDTLARLEPEGDTGDLLSRLVEEEEGGVAAIP